MAFKSIDVYFVIMPFTTYISKTNHEAERKV